MPKELTELDVDVNQYPEPAHYEFKVTEATSGALYADAAKLLYFLIRQGIFEIEEKAYHRLIQLFSEPSEQFTKAKKIEFDRLIQQKLNLRNANVRLRFMGAEIAGRGSNDYFILKLFEKISKHGVNFEFVISNRSYEFVDAFERRHERGGMFRLSRLSRRLTESTEGMIDSICQGIISGSEFVTLFSNYYLPHLKLISYSIDVHKHTVRFYTNREINLEIVAKLALKFKVAFHADSFMALAKTIERINRAFSVFKEEKRVRTLCSEEALALGQAERLTFQDDPLAFLLWNGQNLLPHKGRNIEFFYESDPNEGFNQSDSFSRSSFLEQSMKDPPKQYKDLASDDLDLAASSKAFIAGWQRFFPAQKRLEKLSELDNRLDALERKLRRSLMGASARSEVADCEESRDSASRPR